MESSLENNKIGFIALQEYLLSEVSRRINNGEITERGLARVIGISQPQMHHVLKGKRRLQVDLADRLLEKFGIDLETLFEKVRESRRADTDPGAKGQKQTVEIFPARKGPGREQRTPERLRLDIGS